MLGVKIKFALDGGEMTVKGEIARPLFIRLIFARVQGVSQTISPKTLMRRLSLVRKIAFPSKEIVL